jgi:Domain of unknown function (DUF5615)
MLPGYADENVKAAITAGLRQRGMDVVTAQERGQRGTDDEILLATATAEVRLLLTNDTDFLRIHAEWMVCGRSHAGIVYWPQDRPVGDVVRRLLQYGIQTDPADASNIVKGSSGIPGW